MTRWIGIAALLLLAVTLALTLGVRTLSPADIWGAIRAPDPFDPEHITFLLLRGPRLLAGLVAGAALGMAGMAMQAVTRNPLADPGILGVNAGAAFAVTLGSLLLGRGDAGALSLLAFPGAALASAAVFLLGGGLRGDANPMRLTLAGAALNALLLSLVSSLVLLRGDGLEVMRFWVVGSLADAGARPIGLMTVSAMLGAAIALGAARALETLALGAALSRGLGTRPGHVQLAILVAVTLLAGSAVALAGPIAFLGLVAPPLARHLVGPALRPGLVASAMLGAAILLLADTAGRLVFPPAEIRAGIMTAILGGPVFVLIARRLRVGAPA